jgi:hypothetical protein
MRIAGEFTTTLEFGDSDVDVAVEWSADDRHMHHLEMAVSLANIRLTKDAELAKTHSGGNRIDWVDIQDHLPGAKQQELWDRCFADAKTELDNYNGPEDIDYNAVTPDELMEDAREQKRRLG